MVGDAGAPRVDVGAAELLGGHVLAGRRLHERRAAEEDRAGAADDHRLVAHRRHVGAAGGARAHDHRDLRDPQRRHPRLVEEDPPEVVAVGEDLGLQRQERAAGVDEVEARQAVLLGDLLRAQVLLDREREVRAALHGRVVGDDHALAPSTTPMPVTIPAARRVAVVQLPRRERAELEEAPCRDRAAGRCARVRAASRASGDARRRRSPPPRRDALGALAQLGDERLHPPAVGRVVLRGAVGPGIEDRHYGRGGRWLAMRIAYAQGVT